MASPDRDRNDQTDSAPRPPPILPPSRRGSRRRGRRAITPSSARRCRSSARSSARRSISSAGSKVLDVAAGNGMATLAAARRWCDVTSTDYVPALLERGRARAAAEGLAIEFMEADAENLPFDDDSFDAVLSTFGVMFTPNQDAGGRRAAAGLQARGQDRPRQLDAGRLHRPGLQDARQISAAARRRQIAGAVGHARAARRNVRRRRALDQGRVAPVQLPLSLAGAFPRRVQDLYGPVLKAFAALDAGQAGRAAQRPACADRAHEPLRRRHHGRAERISRGRHHQAVKRISASSQSSAEPLRLARRFTSDQHRNFADD